jgi:hypothetical protein
MRLAVPDADGWLRWAMGRHQHKFPLHQKEKDRETFKIKGRTGHSIRRVRHRTHGGL